LLLPGFVGLDRLKSPHHGLTILTLDVCLALTLFLLKFGPAL
jgi:hypothetical protein